MKRSFASGCGLIARLVCVCVVSFLFAPAVLRAQGITTSTLEGITLDAQGRPVVGARIEALHTPSNTRYEAVTRSNGAFSFSGLRVGGPYEVTVGADGYRSQTKTGVFLELAKPTSLEFRLANETVVMDALIVEADPSDLDPGSTGAGSVMDEARLNAVPTVFRSFADIGRNNAFVSLRASTQMTALGQNSKFNSISVDGARINDQFGLASSGLFSLNNPFSLDALEQFSVSLSPYDTRQSGFTGASINAVTRSGTNRFSGSAYYIFTNEGLQGKDVFGSTAGTRSPLDRKTWGATFGGPILRDRLFFFLNYEKFTQDTTASDPSFAPNEAELQRVYSRIDAITSATGIDADLGTFERPPITRELDEKKLAKIDWNITNDHRLSLRYSETESESPFFTAINASSYSGGTISNPAPAIPNGTTSLSSSFYDLEVTEKVWAGQLFSHWSPNFQTQLNYANTRSSSERVLSTIFPEVRIFNFPGISRTGATINDGSLRFGSENSSQGNQLEVETQSYSLSGDYLWNDYTFTVGFDREESEFFNLFRQNSFGILEYRTVDDFVNDVPSAFRRDLIQAGTPAADISKFEQTGVFTHARWQPNHRLNLLLGLRADFMSSPIKPPLNTAFRDAFGIRNDGTIDGTTTLAPRFSFNYAIDEERRTQVRGGMGVFLGRSPWVFFSNSYGNSGVGRSSDVRRAGTATPPPTLINFLNTSFDSENPIGTTPGEGPRAAVNLVDDGIKLPTVLRSNIAIEQKVEPLDAVLTLEYVHTDVLKGFFIENLNLQPTSVGADGRQRFAGSSSVAPRVAGWPVNVLRVRNVSVGGSRYLSLSLDRPMQRGYAYNVSLTAGKSTEAQAFGSSTANSNWQFIAVFNQNTVEEQRSDFEIKTRVQASFTKEFQFRRNYRTAVSLYYEGRSGSPYSWTYASDLNGDGFQRNDVVAVPTGLDDPRFDFSGLNAQQRDAYFAALEEHGLTAYAGSYVPRNAFRYPWQNRLDLRITQEIPTFRDIRLELFVDFINFGTWLSNDLFNYVETALNPTNTGLNRTFGNASYNASGQIRPTVTLDSSGRLVPAGDTPTPNNGDSRWRLQFGARVKF